MDHGLDFYSILRKEPKVYNYRPRKGKCRQVVDGKPCGIEFEGPASRTRCDLHMKRPGKGYGK